MAPPRLHTDTSPEAEAVQLDLLRQAPPWRKLEMTFSLNRSLRELVIANIRDATPAARQRLFADRCLGPELAEKAYGPLPSTLK